MARPREFEPEKALADAMNVFWQLGYDAASLPDLLDGMGLTRGSLYKAFNDKKSLFLRALNHYETEAVDPAVVLLTTGPADGLDRIATLFKGIADALKQGDRRGCLLCSAAAGPAAVDETISDLVHRQLNRMELAIEVALSESAAFASKNDRERSEVASLLLSQYVGLRVLARSNASVETIEKSAKGLQLIMRGHTAP